MNYILNLDSHRIDFLLETFKYFLASEIKGSSLKTSLTIIKLTYTESALPQYCLL